MQLHAAVLHMQDAANAANAGTAVTAGTRLDPDTHLDIECAVGRVQVL